MIEKTSVNDQFSWLKVQDLSDDDHNELREKYNLPKRFLRYVADVHERARFDTDDETGATLVIFDVDRQNLTEWTTLNPWLS